MRARAANFAKLPELLRRTGTEGRRFVRSVQRQRNPVSAPTSATKSAPFDIRRDAAIRLQSGVNRTRHRRP